MVRRVSNFKNKLKAMSLKSYIDEELLHERATSTRSRSLKATSSKSYFDNELHHERATANTISTAALLAKSYHSKELL